MWIYGTHAAIAALGNSRRVVKRICLLKSAIDEIEPHIVSRHPKWQIVEGSALEKWLGAGAVHQGVALDVEPLPPVALEDIFDSADASTILILDQVTDPHNIGAILRSAAAFGVRAVIMQDRHSPDETPVLAKAASGALECVPLVPVVNIAKAIDRLKKEGYWVAGLAGDAAQTIGEANLSGKVALVLGAEGRGLRRLVAEHCDLLVNIPIDRRMESLNVSNAAAVALYALTQ